METQILEFETYLSLLHAGLKLKNELKEDILKEIRQSLYDKFNDLLIKGYCIENAIAHTLESFEEPAEMAKMFNSIHREKINFNTAIRLVSNKKIVVAAVIATLLMKLLV